MYVSGVGGGEGDPGGGGLSAARHERWNCTGICLALASLVKTYSLALGLLLWTVHRGSSWASRQRTALYRLVEFIGYWSMLDVVVVALTAALLKFKALGTAEPRLGIVFFCGVVVTTMIAALSFDPRLIWDMGAHDGH
jgi:paraquat-inducible protein A